MNKFIDTLRQRVSTSSLRLFSHPYLPSGLIETALLLIFTDWIVILLSQSGAYWVDKTRAVSSLPWFQSLLAAGLPAFALAGLGYLLLAWLLLGVLSRSPAIAMWLPISLVHLGHILSWVATRMEFTMEAGLLYGVSALVLGIVLVQILMPAPQAMSAFRIFLQRLRPILVGLWIIALITALSFSALGKRGGWTRLNPVHSPGRRANAAIAIDPARNRVVLFGGFSDWLGARFMYKNDTWEWDGQDWIELHPDTAPAPRAGHMMAYDQKRNVIVMFGGEEKKGEYMFSDTWEWDGTDWTQIAAAFSPPSRRDGQLFYDPKRETIILSGGFYFSSERIPTMLNDAWEWNGQEWEYLGELSSGLTITDPNTVFDPIQGQTLLFDYNRMLVWQNYQWAPSGIEFTPLPRLGGQIAIDPRSGTVLLFSGINNNQHLEDTWLLEAQTWHNLDPNLYPQPRDAYTMFYDPVRKSFILYGGMTNLVLDDMWELILP